MPRTRASVARARRGGDNRLRDLVVAAVRHADQIESKVDDPDAFMQTDEDLREAALAFERSLSAADRERLGR